ncbi:MAG: hypothetical protein RLZZ174_1339 [Pseudomonadota bacterium]
MRARSLSGVLLALALLVGCSAEAPPKAYVTRLADALELDAPSPPPLRAWPRRRLREATLPAEKTDLLHFLSLQACGLGAVLGERNGALGRVMQAPERLRYEVRFAAGAKACLRGLEGAEQAELAALLARKRAGAPRVLWNATLGSDEWAALYALGAERWAPPDPMLSNQALEALAPWRERAQVLAEDPAAWEALAAAAQSPEAWHAPWAALATVRYPGLAFAHLQRLTSALEAATALLEAREAVRPLCPQGRPTPRGLRVNAVFLRYYGQALQPAMADLERGLIPWLEVTAELWAVLKVGAPEDAQGALAAFLAPASPGPWRRYLAARDAHTAAWQRVLGQCQLMPGRPRPEAED